MVELAPSQASREQSAAEGPSAGATRGNVFTFPSEALPYANVPWPCGCQNATFQASNKGESTEPTPPTGQPAVGVQAPAAGPCGSAFTFPLEASP